MTRSVRLWVCRSDGWLVGQSVIFSKWAGVLVILKAAPYYCFPIPDKDYVKPCLYLQRYNVHHYAYFFLFM